MTAEQAGELGASEAKANSEQPRTAVVPPDAVFGQVVGLLMNIPVYRHAAAFRS